MRKRQNWILICKNPRSELLSVKSSNSRMEEEMRQIKSVNINLRNDVRFHMISYLMRIIHNYNRNLLFQIAQANERTLNVKNNFQKLQQQLIGLRAEQEGQRKLIQRQEGVVKAQQAVLQDTKEETSSLRNLLSSISGRLKRALRDLNLSVAP